MPSFREPLPTWALRWEPSADTTLFGSTRALMSSRLFSISTPCTRCMKTIWKLCTRLTTALPMSKLSLSTKRSANTWPTSYSQLSTTRLPTSTPASSPSERWYCLLLG
jgi:hypothetical protein